MKQERRERPRRIDKLLVDRGLVDSRTKAQALVMEGVVLVDEQRVNKPSDLVGPAANIRIKRADDPSSRYVGRGGLKLALTSALQREALPIVCCNTELKESLPSMLVTIK